MKKCLPAILLLAACPGPSGNPSRLWLAENGVETAVKLQDTEPAPY